MGTQFSSRERMLAAIEHKDVDYVPCCFMIFFALMARCNTYEEFVGKQIELGLDTQIEMPALPFRFHPDVTVRQWKENPPGAPEPLLHKQFITPAGTLETIVRQTEDWPCGDEVPLFNDFLTARCTKFPVGKPEDVRALRYLLGDPTGDDIARFKEVSGRRRQMARDQDLLYTSHGLTLFIPERGLDRDGGTMGVDALFWLCGGENAVYLAMDAPDMFAELLNVISEWNRKRIGIYLDEGADLVIRRAWYESTELWSPALYRKYMAPVVKKEVALAHEAGAKFGTITTSGVTAILDDIVGTGLDVIVGMDPAMGNWPDLPTLKRRTDERIALWGGVNGFLTVEMGTPQATAEAVRTAVRQLGPKGFILSPVDNVRDTGDKAWENVLAFIRTWKEECRV